MLDARAYYVTIANNLNYFSLPMFNDQHWQGNESYLGLLKVPLWHKHITSVLFLYSSSLHLVEMLQVSK